VGIRRTEYPATCVSQVEDLEIEGQKIEGRGGFRYLESVFNKIKIQVTKMCEAK
jgi:hypothetical protein